MRHLSIYETESIDELVWAQPSRELTLQSPATEIFTDFAKYPPMVIEQGALALQTREIMKKEHVRMKIVVDADNHFKGLLPLACLTDEVINKKYINDGFTADNLYVKNCMVEKSAIQALDFKEIQHATIADVVDALEHINHRHCLVINHETHKIRGVISANDISKILNITIDTSGSGSSFLEIFKAVRVA